MSIYFPNLEELSFRTVLAFPKAKRNNEKLINGNLRKEISYYLHNKTSNMPLYKDLDTMKKNDALSKDKIYIVFQKTAPISFVYCE
jgi:hypothetical protein